MYSYKYIVVKQGNWFAEDYELRALIFISFKLFNYFDSATLNFKVLKKHLLSHFEKCWQILEFNFVDNPSSSIESIRQTDTDVTSLPNINSTGYL